MATLIGKAMNRSRLGLDRHGARLPSCFLRRGPKTMNRGAGGSSDDSALIRQRWALSLQILQPSPRLVLAVVSDSSPVFEQGLRALAHAVAREVVGPRRYVLTCTGPDST